MDKHIRKTGTKNSILTAAANTGNVASLQDNRPQSILQKNQADALANKQSSEPPVQKKKNNTGLPDTLKSGIENLSGHSMDDVKVHYNSSQPAQLNAHAYAQGSEIHIASGQEKHLPHEAWHVIQQKQGRVKPTMQLKGKVNVNDDKGLEKEADVMGNKALQMRPADKVPAVKGTFMRVPPGGGIAQRVTTIPVNEDSSQLLTDPGGAEEKRYHWKSSFVIYLYDAPAEAPAVKVVIFIETAADDRVFHQWNESIQAAWSNKFAVRSGAKRYPISVEIARSTDFKNYTVENIKQDASLGKRGLFGTEHMLKWGEEDPQDIPHEVGHMLGNKDEYGTVEGEDWSAKHDAGNRDTHTVMFKGDEPPRMRHFNMILDEIKKHSELEDPEVVKAGGDYGPAAAGPKMLGGEKKAPAMGKAVMAGPAAAMEGMDGEDEREMAMHKRRVKRITAYLIEHVETMSEKKTNWFATHDWNHDAKISARAAQNLGL
jgi:hypothetical protein